jgi:hypothetical protein
MQLDEIVHVQASGLSCGSGQNCWSVTDGFFMYQLLIGWGKAMILQTGFAAEQRNRRSII